MMVEKEKKIKKKIIIKDIPKNVLFFFIKLIKELIFMFKFIILLFFVFIRFLIQKKINGNGDIEVHKITFMDKIRKFYENIYNKVMIKIDAVKQGEVRSSELIYLALRNLRSKKGRTNLTVGGMAIGFGAVLFLLSLGYGFEKLVISKVASLSEMKQIDVNTAISSPLYFSNENIIKINELNGVKDVIPIITSVSKVKYNDSVSDVIVYGVNSRFLEEGGFSPLEGALFLEGELKMSKKDDSSIKGIEVKAINSNDINSSVSLVNYQIYPEVWKPVYLNPRLNSEVIGYTRRELEKSNGSEVWGDRYNSKSTYTTTSIDGKYYSTWISGTFNLYQEKVCSDKDYNCIDGKYIQLKVNDVPVQKLGYITEDNINIDRYKILQNILNNEQSNVLGLDTENDNENFVDINSIKDNIEGVDWESISEKLGNVEKIDKEIVDIPEDAQKVALVNTSMLTLLGIQPSEAVGKVFEATYVFDSKLFNKTNTTIESNPVNIKITGVVSDSKSPTFYTPLNDIRVAGMNNVSKIKVVVDDQSYVNDTRKEIESMGFQTNSVVDTIDNISSLFATLRVLLLVLGLIALSVASLGMFNTLTVSLLEKTREVGLLKTMGLKSNEIKTLFLSESVIMSTLGGIFGLLLALGLGLLLSLVLSLIAISQNQDGLTVTFIPESLAFSVMIVASFVGFVTGWYPAKRAKRISALHALRYE